MSSTEQFSRACSQCRRLIEQQLEALEQLERAQARSPGDPAVAVLRDKVRKLRADTETQFLQAMNSMPSSRS